MIRKLLVSFTIISVFFGILFAENDKKKDNKKDDSEIFETLWEYQFDEPVTDVIFGEEEVTVAEAKRKGWKGFEGKKPSQNEFESCWFV